MSGWNSVGWNRGREGGRGEYVGTSYVPYNYRKEQVERFRYGDNESVNYVETHGHGNGHGQVLGEGQGLSSTG